MSLTQPAQSGGLPARWVLRYVIGAVIVVAGLAASIVATARQLPGLAGQIRALSAPACGPAMRPSCFAEYPATAVQQVPSSSGTFVTVLLRTSFLARTDDRDECFGAACADYVQIPGKDAPALHSPEAVRITAGDSRIVRIQAPGVDVPTTDAPATAVLSSVSGLLWMLYILAFCASFAGAYVVIAVQTRIWRIHPVRWLRVLTVTEVLTGVLGVAAFIGFAEGGPAGLAIVGVAGLGGSISAQVARSHRHPGTVMPSERPTERETAFARRHLRRPLVIALYVLAAFPAVLGTDVALRLIHDGFGGPGAAIFVAAGVALTGFFIYKMRQKLVQDASRPAPAPAEGAPAS